MLAFLAYYPLFIPIVLFSFVFFTVFILFFYLGKYERSVYIKNTMKQWRNCFSDCHAAQARRKAFRTFKGRLRAFLLIFNANANKSDRRGRQHLSQTFPFLLPNLRFPERLFSRFSLVFLRLCPSAATWRSAVGAGPDCPSPVGDRPIGHDPTRTAVASMRRVACLESADGKTREPD